jgi:hypothetical protein
MERILFVEYASLFFNSPIKITTISINCKSYDLKRDNIVRNQRMHIKGIFL